MNGLAKALQLYAVTDTTWLGKRALTDVVEQSILGGVTMVQFRDKELSDQAFLEEAWRIKEVCSTYHVPLIINDRVAIALACDADGVHVGQEDMDPKDLRSLLGPKKIIGVSAHTRSEALRAEKAGADYLGAGAVFTTQTKEDADVLAMETLRDICRSVRIPVCAIGGVQQENIPLLGGTGVQGVAVVSALFAAADITLAAKELKAGVDAYILSNYK